MKDLDVSKLKAVNLNINRVIPNCYKGDELCVYTHTLISTGIVFYVGCGSIYRAYNHTESNRSRHWNNYINGRPEDIRVDIVKCFANLEEAYKYESEMIAKYGRICNNSGTLVNIDDGGSVIGRKGSECRFYNQNVKGDKNPNFGNKYEKNNNSKPVIQMDIFGDLIKTWSSATEAEELGGFTATNISQCCNGIRHIHNNYQWIWEADYNKEIDYFLKDIKNITHIYLCLDKDYNLIEIFPNPQSIVDMGFNMKVVSAVCNGNKKSHKGYIFRDYYKCDREIQIELKEIVKSLIYN